MSGYTDYDNDPLASASLLDKSNINTIGDEVQYSHPMTNMQYWSGVLLVLLLEGFNSFVLTFIPLTLFVIVFGDPSTDVNVTMPILYVFILAFIYSEANFLIFTTFKGCTGDPFFAIQSWWRNLYFTFILSKEKRPNACCYGIWSFFFGLVPILAIQLGFAVAAVYWIWYMDPYNNRDYNTLFIIHSNNISDLQVILTEGALKCIVVAMYNLYYLQPFEGTTPIMGVTIQPNTGLKRIHNVTHIGTPIQDMINAKMVSGALFIAITISVSLTGSNLNIMRILAVNVVARRGFYQIMPYFTGNLVGGVIGVMIAHLCGVLLVKSKHRRNAQH